MAMNQADGNFPAVTALLTAAALTPIVSAMARRLTAKNDALLESAEGRHSRCMTVDRPYAEIGARLEALRIAMGETNQRAWADHNGFSPTRYNNWAKGRQRISVESAEILCDRYGLTLDAIYRGRLDGLSENMRKVFPSALPIA